MATGVPWISLQNRPTSLSAPSSSPPAPSNVSRGGFGHAMQLCVDFLGWLVCIRQAAAGGNASLREATLASPDRNGQVFGVSRSLSSILNRASTVSQLVEAWGRRENKVTPNEVYGTILHATGVLCKVEK
ncbi:hypothetical protein GX51_03681 [Blastomyces parvus]|uniref:Uncharacterized protein n=1 Tax=Blastomyces parvus TaxID=2060905 RepID=A0A2B7WXT2_9EURO|nr:hypothetical protein GX51_03681 [Blastomyces parvus]